MMVASMRFFMASTVFLVAVLLGACGITTPTLTGTVPTALPLTSTLQIEITSVTSTSEPIPLDTAYYDGIIVITQYYTFLGYGLYENAYGLLSTSAQKPHTMEEYVTATQMAFKIVEIVTIQPLNERIQKQGISNFVTPDPPERKRYYVEIRAWGKGNMSGSRMNGDLQIIILTLVKEDGKWKIESFSQ